MHTTTHILFKQSPCSLHYIPLRYIPVVRFALSASLHFAPFRSRTRQLLSPKKTTLHSKNRASPTVNGKQTRSNPQSHTNPRPPTPKQNRISSNIVDIQLLLPEKKEYAKVAITISGCQGQALRVFEKKSPHLRFAPGSIFFQKTLTSANRNCCLKAYPFFLLFREKK